MLEWRLPLTLSTNAAPSLVRHRVALALPRAGLPRPADPIARPKLRRRGETPPPTFLGPRDNDIVIALECNKGGRIVQLTVDFATIVERRTYEGRACERLSS